VAANIAGKLVAAAWSTDGSEAVVLVDPSHPAAKRRIYNKLELGVYNKSWNWPFRSAWQQRRLQDEEEYDGEEDAEEEQYREEEMGWY